MRKTNVLIEGTKITWGKESWDKYKRFGSCGNEWSTLEAMLGKNKPTVSSDPFASLLSPNILPVPTGGMHLYKNFSEAMGCTPSSALSALNKLMYKVWILPIGRDVVWAYCRENATNVHKRFLNANKLADMHNQMDKILVCLADNQKHLIPLCVGLKSTPKEIKDRIPKAVWKQLINNSLTRNGFIARDLGDKRIWENLVLSSQLSSSLLKGGWNIQSGRYVNISGMDIVEELKPIYLNNLAKENKFLSNKSKLRETWDLLVDTTDMAEELGKNVNYRWKLNRWHEEHNKLSKEITARKYSDIKFTHKNMAKLKPIIEDGGYVATLLDSQLKIGLEGKDMDHCVASYAEYAAKGNYAVYSITNPEGSRSTLGLNINKEGDIVFNQHYGKHNKRVNNIESRFGKNIVSDLNGEPYLILEWEKTK